jgi:hypothetical protein
MEEAPELGCSAPLAFPRLSEETGRERPLPNAEEGFSSEEEHGSALQLDGHAVPGSSPRREHAQCREQVVEAPREEEPEGPEPWDERCLNEES